MPNKRKYISTEYGMVNLRDGDTILHLDAEILADIYWRVLDGKLTEVVRCKDCVHYWKNYPTNEVRVCIASPKADAYCSEGERKEDAEID